MTSSSRWCISTLFYPVKLSSRFPNGWRAPDYLHPSLSLQINEKGGRKTGEVNGGYDDEKAGNEVKLVLKHYKATTPFLLKQFGR